MALRRKSTVKAAVPVVIAVARIRRKENNRFPRVNYSVPDDSKYQTHNGKLHAIITTTPRGLDLAWDNCGLCLQHIRGCKCDGGITLPSSIGYLYTKEGGMLPPRPTYRTEDRPFFVPKPKARKPTEDRFPQFQQPAVIEEVKPPKRKLRRKGEGVPTQDPVPAELKPAKRRLKRKAA